MWTQSQWGGNHHIYLSVSERVNVCVRVWWGLVILLFKWVFIGPQSSAVVKLAPFIHQVTVSSVWRCAHRGLEAEWLSFPWQNGLILPQMGVWCMGAVFSSLLGSFVSLLALSLENRTSTSRVTLQQPKTLHSLSNRTQVTEMTTSVYVRHLLFHIYFHCSRFIKKTLWNMIICVLYKDKFLYSSCSWRWHDAVALRVVVFATVGGCERLLGGYLSCTFILLADKRQSKKWK